MKVQIGMKLYANSDQNPSARSLDPVTLSLGLTHKFVHEQNGKLKMKRGRKELSVPLKSPKTYMKHS